MTIKRIIFVLSIFATSLIIAQTNPNGQSTKITVFSTNDSSYNTPKNQPPPPPSLHKDMNCIKWNYSLLARGVFLLNYEFPISSKLSTEVGLGVTLQDYIFEYTNTTGILDYGSGNASNTSFGFAAEGGIRYYPLGFDNFEGFFLSPMISYRTYAVSDLPQNITGTTTTPAPTAGFSPGYTFTDFQFKIGYAYESLWSWDIMGEVYAGFALRYADLKYYDQTTSAPSQTTLQIPQVLLGFKVGLPF